ncbi:MAG: protein kinase domain-containing protein, partial [Jiangellaceae bacterium]
MDLFVTDTRIGRLIDGRYRVESVLARGGMATVYRALDARLERTVALKIMHPELAADDEFVVRFIGEARSAARLSDPHVVAVFDQGDDDGAVFLAMEYVEGATLREALREHGRLDAEVALEVTESVLTALSAAHRAGIVHRDVKPENVLVGEDGRVKVADFGLARALSNSSNATQGPLLGTVNYISPEQALGEPATPRSDVYSAGIMLYELLTGFAPHTGPTDFIVVRSHIDQDVPPPSAAVPVPPAVDELVRTATARDPGDRYADAQRFLDALHRVQALLPASGLDDADQTIIGAEAVEAAGVTLSTALQDTMLSSAAVTPVADHAGAVIDSDPAHTRIIQPSPATPPPVGRRAARAGSARASNHHRQRRSVRGPILFAVVLVIAIAVAGGAWWLGAGRWTSTPALLNLTPEAAVAKADQSGLSAVVDGEAFSETVEVGLVVGTDPAPGAKIRRDGEVGLTLSKGPERYEIPDLVGMTLEEATA